MNYPIKIEGKTIKQITKLNLSGLGLKEFPENVFEYTNLTKLVLSNNQIKVIPKEILKLKKLKVLDLANNNLSVLQSAVFKLKKLQTLNLYGNNIRKFPKQVFESSIKRLIIGKNPIETATLAQLEIFCEVIHTLNKVTIASEVDENNNKEEKTTKKEKSVMDKKHNIFISYSHKDKDWLDKVLTHLKPLQRYYNLNTWSDIEIMASDVWKDKIDDALNKTTIAILLVSSDFLASDFINNEELQPLLEKALKYGTKILSIIVRPCSYFEECGLSKYQAVNDPKLPLSGMSEYEQECKLVEMVGIIKKIISKP